jgi:hypothetical protein
MLLLMTTATNNDNTTLTSNKEVKHLLSIDPMVNKWGGGGNNCHKIRYVQRMKGREEAI